MKILFVFADDFPLYGACTNILNHLLETGILQSKAEKIGVLSAKFSFDEKDFETIDNTDVYRTFVWEVFPLKAQAAKLSHFFNFLRGAAVKTFSLLKSRLSPDSYIKPSFCGCIYKKLKKIKAGDFDIIVAMSGDFNIAEAVRKYCEKHPGPKFALYQVDPCSNNESMPVSTKKARLATEAKVFASSDIIFTTPLIYDYLIENYPSCAEKTTALEFPNVVRPAFLPSAEKEIDFIFTGSLYGGIRDPKYTLRLIESVLENEKSKFYLVGVSPKDIGFEYNTEKIICTGKKSMKETAKTVSKSRMLVNIGNKMKNQVPSKLFDYISTGKPIINVCKNPDCFSKEYLKKYPLAINVDEDDALFEKQVASLKEFIEKIGDKSIGFDEVRALYEECTPEYCARKLLDGFCEIIKK
ncbi:MAG: hypothetical protein K6D98_03625 [Clostridiales bacterium]|nr:hypothetical protein [Clostridiales bacterium]